MHSEKRWFINPIIENFRLIFISKLLKFLSLVRYLNVVWPHGGAIQQQNRKFTTLFRYPLWKINQYFYNPGNWVTNNNGSKSVHFTKHPYFELPFWKVTCSCSGHMIHHLIQNGKCILLLLKIYYYNTFSKKDTL